MKYALLTLSLLVSGALFAEESTDTLLTNLTNVMNEIKKLKAEGKSATKLWKVRDPLEEQIVDRLAKAMIEGQKATKKIVTFQVNPMSPEGEKLRKQTTDLTKEIEKILHVLHSFDTLEPMGGAIFAPEETLKK